MKETLPVRVRFGAFDLDLKAGELRLTTAPEGESRIVLPDQPFRLLVMLVEREGTIVTREEIQKKFWPNDTIVEFDHSINVAIGKLRKALGDSADEPKYIETVARRGYRLMVPVERVEAAADEPPNDEPFSDTGAAVEIKSDSTGLIGKKVSHYRVLDIIGGGGMGVVYRAEDLKLGRRVALKFLPEELASDPVAMQRFEREAQTASSLNHPNICTIYEIEEHEGQPFLVMELLEGKTLRDRLASSADNSVELDELLDIAIQICEGLQAAHERGIIHRDIKPANIFLTDKGVCKILDFGLAKLVAAGEKEQAAAVQAGPDGFVSGHDFSRADAAPPQILSGLQPAADSHLTRTGSAMGTAGYMSPEQVRGEKLDARTDVFSFGLVLYEMATGQRAFSGETAAIVQNAILNHTPALVRELNSTLPPKLVATIDKALEKDRERRYQSAAEMRDDLKGLHRGAESAVQKPRRYARVLLFAATLVVIALLLFGWGRRWFKGQPIAPSKMLSERQLTHNPSENRLLGAAISPDGKCVAYIDPRGLHLSVIETGEIHDIPLPEELRTHLWEVTWFPDGEKLILMASSDTEGYTIWVTSVFGGAPGKLGSGRNWPGPVVSPKGSLIAFVSGHDHEIWMMGANGENPRRILSGGEDTYAALAWSPSGQRLAYTRTASGRAEGSIETLSLDGGPASVVFSDPLLRNGDGLGLLWAADGRIIFTLNENEGTPVANANLWEIMADPQTGKPSGRATKITAWDGVHPWSPTVSRDAKRLALVKSHIRDDVYVGELKDGGTRLASPTRLTVSDSLDFPSGWTRDSKTIFFTSNRLGRRQVFRQQMDWGTAEPLIRGPDEEEGAELSPDGRWILYWSLARSERSPSTTKRLMRFPALGGSPEQVLEARMDDVVGFHCPVRPASSCVFSHWEQGQLIFYALDPIHGRGKELARTTLGSPSDYDLAWGLSPEGLRLALASRDQLRDQIRILDSRNGTERNVPLPHGWSIWSLSWTTDGDALFAGVHLSTGYFIAHIELDGKTRVLLDRGQNQVLDTLCPSRDGRHLAFSQRTFENNAWLLENF